MKHGHPRVWRRYQRYFVERDLWKGDADWYRYLPSRLSVCITFISQDIPQE